MATLTYDAETVGQARMNEVFAQGGRAVQLTSGLFSFDNSYPTGGEDISDIWNQFGEVHGIFFEQPILVGTQTGKFLKVDYTAKKVLLYTNASPFAEVGNASDQSAITNLRWVAIGYR